MFYRSGIWRNCNVIFVFRYLGTLPIKYIVWRFAPMTAGPAYRGLKKIFFKQCFFRIFLDIRGQNLRRCGSKADWNRILSHAVPHEWFWRPYDDVIAQNSIFHISMAYDVSIKRSWNTELISGSFRMVRVPFNLGVIIYYFDDVIMTSLRDFQFHGDIACNMSTKRYLNRTYLFCLNRGEITTLVHLEWFDDVIWAVYIGKYILIIAVSLLSFWSIHLSHKGHLRSPKVIEVTKGHWGQKSHLGQKCIFKRNIAIILS